MDCYCAVSEGGRFFSGEMVVSTTTAFPNLCVCEGLTVDSYCVCYCE